LEINEVIVRNMVKVFIKGNEIDINGFSLTSSFFPGKENGILLGF